MTEITFNDAATTKSGPQPWLSSMSWDCLFIIGPAFIASFLVLAFRPWMESLSTFPVWAWVCLVLLVDVSHVYASLFRTYLNKDAFAHNRTLLLSIPLACWVIGALLYSVDALLFWRGLAYLAVFHFIRQQYGFIAMYSRKDPEPFKRYRRLDELAIYVATIYPLLYWHSHLPRAFNWFVDGDFAALPTVFADVGFVIYLMLAACYCAKEALLYKTTNFINVPRNLLIVGTAISWWVGIVSLNSDFAFTMTNVLAHGIPYMALVWLYHKQTEPSVQPQSRPNYLLRYVPLFLLFLAGLAYLEEGLWDGMVWREHLAVFPGFSALPQIHDPAFLALLIPLLALPQSTHYVLDGFIWRIKDVNSTWSLRR